MKVKICPRIDHVSYTKYGVFYVQLAHIGGILGILKSVSALFFPFFATKANILSFPHQKGGRQLGNFGHGAKISGPL